jgi:Divergent InlB B-repeat domain
MNILAPILAVTLAWDASPEPVEGYKLHYGPTQGTPSIHRDFGKVTQATVDNAELPAQSTIFFTATAYNAGLESEPSNEVAFNVPIPELVSLIGVKFGSLDLPQGTQVVVQADPPPAGESFAGWTGDTAILTNPSQPSTTAIIPATDTKIEATYTTSNQASAAFIKTDSTTQGNWKGVYGENGQVIISDTKVLPTWATVAVTGSLYTWQANPSETLTAALQRADAGRVAACQYSVMASTPTIDVNFSDGLSHEAAIYCLDWDTSLRNQRIDVIDAVTGAILDTRSAVDFHDGRWFVWNIKGHVKICLTWIAGYNAVVSGIFIK